MDVAPPRSAGAPLVIGYMQYANAPCTAMQLPFLHSPVSLQFSKQRGVEFIRSFGSSGAQISP